MCTYMRENNKPPHCTHDCDGCVWHEEDDDLFDPETGDPLGYDDNEF